MKLPGEPPASLETLARRLEAWTDRRALGIVLLLSVGYAAEAVLMARHKPLWFDEIFTSVTAGAPDLAATWKANDALDFTPPLNALVTHLVVKCLGLNEVTMRIPAMAGFWFFCLCLFRFVRRRAGVFYAFAALLLPAATEAFRYAIEARPYGLVLGFCGLALLAWESAPEHVRLAAPVLAVGLGCAISSHYYAGMMWIPLAGGELWRSYGRRRIDGSIWAAFLLALTPVVWRLASIHRVIDAVAHSWSPAHPGQILEFWRAELDKTLALLPLFLAGLAIAALFPDRGGEEDRPPTVAGHEWICGILLLGLPIVAVAAGMLFTHVFTPRYALIALIGFFLLAPLLTAHFTRGRALPGLVCMVVAAVPFGFRAHNFGPTPNPLDSEPMLVKALAREPVAISDALMFLQMWYYAPPPLKQKIVYLADRDHPGFFDLRRWVPIPVLEYESFSSPGREFLLYENLDSPEWILDKLLKHGHSTRIEEFTRTRMLVRIR